MADSGNKTAVGSSKVAARVAERANVSNAFNADPKYRKYIQQVDKCLASFEAVHEWADFIAFLTKLLKTLQSYLQYKEIPRKLIVGKRLAQCLNPALPTGVHQRALDVYSHILSVLGPEGLQRDLQIWSAGLFPFFAYSATSVRPILLTLYETYYLALKENLRPVMKAFVLALLPGLEEENSEFFDKVLHILDRASQIISQSFFLQNIWLVLLTAPAARGTAVQYLSRRFPKLSDGADLLAIVGRDIGLMIRAFASSLEDDDILVRRGILELLNTSFKMDGEAFKKSQSRDQEILVKAASGVVLRRDLSLSRRLYSWLLGTSESSETQIEYFRKHGLDLLKKTLRADMFVAPQSGADPRPYKIFISLLDKYEIGAPLTDVIILDAMRAIQKQLSVEDPVRDGDILMTASTLYEVIEPMALWGPLFKSIVTELVEQDIQPKAIPMVRFILRTFKTHDEEVLHVHFPLILTAITEMVEALLRLDQTRVELAAISEAIGLIQEMTGVLSPGTLSRPIEIPNTAEEVPGKLDGPSARAFRHYKINQPSLLSSCYLRPDLVPFDTLFEDLLSISAIHAATLPIQKDPTTLASDSLSRTLLLIQTIMSRVDDRIKAPVRTRLTPRQWLDRTLPILDEGLPFELVDRTIATILALSDREYVQPKLLIDERPIMSKMIHILLSFLRPDWVPYHVKAVQLIWAVQTSTRNNHVESIICQSLSDPEGRFQAGAYDAFGVLWRLTDDSLLPGFHFKVPMMIVLNSLKSEDTARRRVGETWMRCCLKSYLRVLDPILYELVDPAVQRVPVALSYQGREVRGFVYRRPIDQRRLHHLMESLLSVVKFGGPGFSRVVRTTPLKKSAKSDLLARAENASVAHDNATYMDVIIDVLLRYIQSEPPAASTRLDLPANTQLQASALDLLQALVSKGDIDPLTLDNVEAAIISKLYGSVHSDRLELQNKILHTLHSVIIASTTAESSASPGHALRGSEFTPYIEEPLSAGVSASGPTSPVKLNPLLVQTLIDGLSKPSNRPILQHWIDFVLMTVPQFQHSLSHLVFPLCDCICRQLRLSLEDVVKVYIGDKGKQPAKSATTDAGLIMLLNALERLVLLGLAKSESMQPEDDSSVIEKPTSDGGGLLGLVSNVFGAESSNVSDEYLAPRSPAYYCLDEAVRVLYAIWIVMVPASGRNDSTSESFSLLTTRVRLRCRKVLERLFRSQAPEVLESLIECWERTDPIIHASLKGQGTFEIIDILSANAQTVVHMLCESITYRITTNSDRTKKLAINPNLPDGTIFLFLEEYMAKLEGPIAVQVWNRFLVLAKEIISSVYSYKRQLFPALRCFTVLSEKVTLMTAAEDKRLRKELQDVFTKLADTCILIAGRSFDQGNWIRRGNRDLAAALERSSTPIPRAQSDLALNEKADSPAIYTEDGQRPNSGPDLIEQIDEFLATKLIPNVRRFLVDSDKVLALCTNIVYYVITPSMKSKGRTLEVDDTVLTILIEMVKIPSALKAWRTPIYEAFNDNRFFNGTPTTNFKWRPLIRTMMEADKTVLTELLGKLTAASSANIFTNREYEMLLRSLNMRRLSYVIFAGDRNQYLVQLPAIQEKLVDFLRAGTVAPVVITEVYLCLRVLLCRLSPHNMNSFWPVILTELFRVFEQCITSPPPDGADELLVVLAACKFLDLVLVLQTEEFQVQQWMFVTDTVDAVYRPEKWIPEAVMDQLAEIVGDLPDVQGHNVQNGNGVNALPSILERPPTASVNGSFPFGQQNQLRRPLLSSVRNVDSIRDLVPFFSHISLSSYESVYSSAVSAIGSSGSSGGATGSAIDWDAVEKNLLEEIFEGR